MNHLTVDKSVHASICQDFLYAVNKLDNKQKRNTGFYFHFYFIVFVLVCFYADIHSGIISLSKINCLRS